MKERYEQQNNRHGFTPTNEERGEHICSFRPSEKARGAFARLIEGFYERSEIKDPMSGQYRYDAVGANGRRGFTLLIAILVIGVVLAIGLSILNITLREYLLSGIARESAIALNAADAGMECALYWDRSSEGDKFDVGAPAPSITCMGQTVGGAIPQNTVPQNFQFEWGTPKICAKVSVTKYFSLLGPVPMDVGTCPKGVECTRTVSLGYNKACSNLVDLRTVERGLRARY